MDPSLVATTGLALLFVVFVGWISRPILLQRESTLDGRLVEVWRSAFYVTVCVAGEVVARRSAREAQTGDLTVAVGPDHQLHVAWSPNDGFQITHSVDGWSDRRLQQLAQRFPELMDSLRALDAATSRAEVQTLLQELGERADQEVVQEAESRLRARLEVERLS